MKSISAVSIKQCDRAARTVGDYHDTVLLGLQAALCDAPVNGGSRNAAAGTDAKVDAIIAIGSDRGLCGRFNETIAAKTAAVAAASAPANTGSGTGRPLIIAVGARAAARLDVHHCAYDALIATPTAAKGLAETTERILVLLDRERRERQIDAVVVINNARDGDHVAHAHTRRLLPVDHAWLKDLKSKPWPSRGLPMHTVDRETLFSMLIREHLFVSVFRALADSVASEHAARLAAMQRADRHIDDYLETLAGDIRRERQTTITQELLDVVSSYEILKARKRRRSKARDTA